MLHGDYLFIGLDKDERYQYLLVLKDDFSGFVRLIPTRYADAETFVEAMTAWISDFGPPEVLVTDQGSHFKNHVSDRLRQRYGYATISRWLIAHGPMGPLKSLTESWCV